MQKKIKKSDIPPEKMPRNYSFMRAVHQDRLYKSNIETRNKYARQFIESYFAKKRISASNISPGQLIMFDYFEPKTMEELEYYDARPCTIFFGNIETENGTRIIGFNLHYFPPKYRWKILGRILEIFRPFYKKMWTSQNIKKSMPYFTYRFLFYQIQSAKLDFGVRMYIPELVSNIIPIPASGWVKASLTEGVFRKKTRDAIMNYWKNKNKNTKLIKNIEKHGI